MSAEFTAFELEVVCHDCTQERLVAKRDQEARRSFSPSPACVALFRFAFRENHQHAWACIHEIFRTFLEMKIGNQARFDVDDVIQQTWLDFYRGTSRGFVIQDDNQLGPILAYLQKCALHVLAQMARKPSERLKLESLEEMIETVGIPFDEVAQAQLRIDLERALADFFQQVTFTEDEKALFELKFVQRLKPAEILADWPHLAADYQTLERALQRITRRVRQYEGFRNLAPSRQKSSGSALLKMVSVQPAETKEIDVDQPCAHDEVVLLDYVLGLLAPSAAAAIEASPICMQEVRRLAYEMGPFLQLIYRMNCPSPEALVDYEQRHIAGTERLVIYRHIENCMRCQEDMHMLAAVNAEMETVRVPLLRRLIEAIYQSPLAYGLQGDWLHYQTPDIFVNVSVNQPSDRRRGWDIHLQLRAPTGELQTSLAESASIVPLHGDASAGVWATFDQRKRSLIFRDVPTDEYSLTVIMATEEIVIRKLSVGFGA